MPDSSVVDSPYAWFRLCLTVAVSIIANAGMWAIIVIMPAVEAEFGAERAAASLPYSFTMIGFALGNFAIGRWSDRYGVTGALILAAFGVAAGYGTATLAGSVAMLCLAQLLVGFASAAGFGPLIADTSHWFRRRRGIAVALVASGNYLAGAFWPTVLASVLEDHGWRATYLVLAAAALVGMIPLSFALRRKLPEGEMARADAASYLNAKSAGLSPRALQYLLGLAGIGCCVAMSMPQVHIVAYCVDLGFGAGVGAEMLALMLMAGVVSRLVSGLVADRLGGVKTLLIGSSLQCVALFLYLPSDALASLYLVSLLFGLSQGGIVPSYALIVREYMPSHEAGARVGFVMMATIFGMALGGWMTGLIFDATGSYQWAFLNGILWNVLNIGIIFWLWSRSAPRRKATVPA